MTRAHASETARIVALPRKAPHPQNARARLEALLKVELRPLLEHSHGWPGSPPDSARKTCMCKDGACQRLLDTQVEVFTEALLQERAHPQRGVVVRAGVGAGKTIISLALPTLLKCSRPVLLLPGKLREKTLRQLPEIRRHWKIRADILIHTYEEISNRPTMLADLGADLIVFDEAHRLARLGSGRTKRALRFAHTRPECRWYPLSGTFDKRSPKDAAHLVELALRGGAYYPTHERELDSWHHVLGSRGSPEATDWGTFRPVVDAFGERLERWDQSSADRVQLCREALERRVSTCPGVVTSHTLSCDASVLIRRVKRTPPAEIIAAIQSVETTKQIPGSSGASVVTEQDAARVSDTLSLGFYYRWCWEQTRVGEPDTEWMGARKWYSSELSEYLVPTGQGERNGIDTPGHVWRLAEQRSNMLPASLQAAWHAWSAVRDRYRVSYLDDGLGSARASETIPVEPVWLTREVVQWMLTELDVPGTILWYHHRAVARALQDAGARVWLRGQEPPNDGVSCALSEHSHGEGHDLYAFGRVVVPCPGPSGSHLEQMIGRIHRPGQILDEVGVDLWIHTDRLASAVTRAVADARYLHETQGPQRLIVGTWVD